MERRTFLSTLGAAGITAATGCQYAVQARERNATTAAGKNRKILLRSSWQTVNICDIAHTPGMLRLLEQHRPDCEVTLWPNAISSEVQAILRKRFPQLKIVMDKAGQAAALDACDFFLHGSGPGLVGLKETQLAATAKKPYGIGGITLNDNEIKNHRELLQGAQFVFLRDTDSKRALEASGFQGPPVAFGPDATFALDIRDDHAAEQLFGLHQLTPGKYLCAIPRLRWTPYWEIHPESRKPDSDKIAVNEKYVESDHAKLRAGIVAWVRETRMRVLLAPEMTYQVALLKPLLFDPLPDDVKPFVATMDRYWLTAEANSVYANAAAIASMEQHSPIMGIASGVPSILLRQPTDTRKGQMWRDIQLDSWIFEMDDSTGDQIAKTLLSIANDLPAARATAAKARDFTAIKMAEMIAAIG